MQRPDYNAENEKRQERFKSIYGNPKIIQSAKIYYSTRPIEFIEHWGVTYDPRNAGTNVPTLMPFLLFEKQKEFIHFLNDCLLEKENGAIEKCRDVGATWCGVNFSIWLWLFQTGASIGWGSRKEQLVDKIGDPDSIFEKLRKVIQNMPSFLKPIGFDDREHSSYMKLINPEKEGTITGEAGDNIGRGGRKTIYFKDESAHYQRPELIEAALGDNTDVQIDISSVNGTATIFQRRIDSGEIWSKNKKIESGKTRIFIFDWRDHPYKTQEWYDKRRAKAEREGLLHVFAQEVDRDSTAAVEGTLIPTEWVKSAIDSHKTIGFNPEGKSYTGFDVADEGRDNHAVAIRKGVLLQYCEDWHSGDVGQATQKALAKSKNFKVSSFQYDCIGVGAGVKSETNRMIREGNLDKKIEIVSWNAASAALFPKQHIIKNDKESPINKDFFANLKAQGYWNLRIRFEKTYKVVKNGDSYPEDELISLSSDLPELHNIVNELSQPTYSINGAGKMVVDKSPDGARSPNKADAIMMSYHPKTAKRVFI